MSTTESIDLSRLPSSRQHVAALAAALRDLDVRLDQIEAWGRHLAAVLVGGGRLLACGNGGSAAQAQHLTSELVGRYRDDRPPFSALSLCAETSSLTAIGNDYGPDEVFARQVRAHGRQGDVLVALSTSGRSANVVAAVDAAVDAGMTTWAVTGPAPNPLADRCDGVLAIDAAATATVQEVSLVAIHLLCSAVDVALPALLGAATTGGRP